MQRKAAALRQGRRPALRLHLGLDQVHPRVGPGRVAVLPGGDGRGRRGPALHRAPDGRCWPPRTSATPTRRRCRSRSPRRTRSSTSGCRSARSRSPRPRSTSSLAPKSNVAGRGARRRAGAHPRARRAAPARRRCAPPRIRRRAQARPRRRLRLPARPPRRDQRPGAPARAAASTCASTSPGDAEPELRDARWQPRSAMPAAASALRRVRRSTRGARRAAQPLWSLLPVAARARYMRRAAVALLDELDELAPRLAEETGWPRSQLVLSELLPGRARAARAGRRRAARAGRPAPAAARALLAGRSTRLVQSPVGVVGLRGPSASPFAEPALEAAAALLAGNAVILAGGARSAPSACGRSSCAPACPGELLIDAPRRTPT